MNQGELPVEDRISVRDAFLRFGSWIKYLLSNWKSIVVGTIIISALYILKDRLSEAEYTAETTFVVAGSGNQGDVSSLASAVGVNLGGLDAEGSLFTTDNMFELYKSFKILKETFLIRKDFDGENKRLITRYLEQKELLEKWREEDDLKNISFELQEDQLTVVHDSLLKEVLEKFIEKEMGMSKISRKSTLLSAVVKSKDPLFAKYFNEELVRNVNEFYAEIRTKKTKENLSVLQRQVDSVRLVIDKSLALYERIQNYVPNANPLVERNSSQLQRLQIDIEASSSVYKEALTQLEISKIEHQQTIPLIQIVDSPTLPLESDKPKLIKLIIVSVFLGAFLMVCFYSTKALYRNIMSEER